MKISDIQNILSKQKGNITFLVGNGINRYFENDSISWYDLLLELWDKYSFETQSVIPSGISFTEFYDILEIQNNGIAGFSNQIQKEVKNLMFKWTTNKASAIILNKIKAIDAPLLTTNFDDLIPQSLNLDFRKLQISGFTDYYPWSCYYSDRDLNSPTEGFGVWYPNGMIKYHRSIKLGLSQYMGNVAMAKKYINSFYKSDLLSKKKQEDALKTWLHLFFHHSVFIFGLSLDESEIFIRWLLIERAKYYRMYPGRKCKGWYISKTNENQTQGEGKKFFLKSVGIEYINFDEFKSIYETIWVNV